MNAQSNDLVNLQGTLTNRGMLGTQPNGISTIQNKEINRFIGFERIAFYDKGILCGASYDFIT